MTRSHTVACVLGIGRMVISSQTLKHIRLGLGFGSLGTKTNGYYSCFAKTSMLLYPTLEFDTLAEIVVC